MNAPTRLERRETFYTGRVQGVGFRYRTFEIAKRYAVTGYVRNLNDGRVQLVIEGDGRELTKMLAEIALEMRGNVHDAVSNNGPATGEFADFAIRR